MTPIILKELEILSHSVQDVLLKLLIASQKSSGDLLTTEIGLETALSSLRSLLVCSAVSLCVSSADHDYYCPDCSVSLSGWGTRVRPIVTCIGEGTFPSQRYHCRACRKDYYPWQVQQGLDGGNEFTISARELIAREGADGAFDAASHRLLRMGIPVSSSEVDKICREVATWRKQEQNVVREHSCRFGQSLALPMHQWESWPDRLSATDLLIFSVDGSMVRSDQRGPKGLEWFEVRSGLMGLVRKDKPFSKFTLGGLMSPDEIFETMRSQWMQSRLASNQKGARPLRMVFVADGAEWIWARAGWYFPNCIQVLDIFHAAGHVGAAARAAWGPCGNHTKRWIDGAMSWLLEADGAKSILKALIGKLRCSNAADSKELTTQFRYLWSHRHRMDYHTWSQQGLTIGSGAIESCVKQTNTKRLNQPGMMWTKKNADLMMHLRAACLSNSISLTVQRERKIRANRALQFRRQTTTMADAV